MKEISFRVIESTAAQSLSKTGQILKAGKKTSRLDLGDSRFNVAVKRINESNPLDQLIRFFGVKLGYFVEFKNINQETKKTQILLINVNSLADRLLYSKKRLIKASPEEVKKLLLTGGQNTDFIIREYQKFLGNDLAKKDITTRLGQKQMAFSKESLMKVIRAAYQTETVKYAPTFDQNRTLHNFRYDKKAKDLKFVSFGDILGKGGFGKATLVKESANGQESVFKNPRKAAGISGVKDIHNEYEILEHFHREGRRPRCGIPPKPMAYTHLTRMSRSGQLVVKKGFQMARADGDYQAYINRGRTPFQNQLIEFYQLFLGLKHLEDENIIHSDIKFTNIFTKRQNGYTQVYFADFGGGPSSG